MRKRGVHPLALAQKLAYAACPMVTRYRHGSVIVDRRNRIIGTGRNHFDGCLSGNVRTLRSVHAEVDALRKVNVRRLSGAFIVNYAMNGSSTVCARPCPTCWAILKNLGFDRVIYSMSGELSRPQWEEVRF